MGLGINKDLEPLVRAVRRMGGTVEITASNHVKWTMPDGAVIRTGLTMNSRSARQAQRQVEKALEARATTTPTPVEHSWRPVQEVRGKYHLLDEHGQPMRNAAGFARTFSTLAAATAAAEATGVD